MSGEIAFANTALESSKPAAIVSFGTLKYSATDTAAKSIINIIKSANI